MRKPDVAVSQLLCQVLKKFQRQSVGFWGQITQWRYWLCTILKPEARNSRWRRQTGCTCISASMQDSKEIPTAICIFSGLENTVALLVLLYFGTGSEKFKITATKSEVHVSQLQYKIAKNLILFSGPGNSMTTSKGSMWERK
jgi:hypothetical protein